ncbi:metallophosphoesterase, partial [Patescibacteria group bacterium]|nr:metallophosphoesterase [Patescibacteria group bacterium]
GDKKIHPVDLIPGWKEKFGTVRTMDSMLAKLAREGVAYGNNLTNAQKEAKPADIPRKQTIKQKETSERELREKLSSMGYRVEKVEQASIDRRFKVDSSMFDGDEYKIAIVSCTHLGSKYQQLTHLKSFYQYAQDQGIKVVLNCGDVVDGIRIYRGQEYELFIHGSKAQREYAIENYPKMENGGKTIMISGNHDYSFMSNGGEKIIETICDKRDDLEYVGDYGAYPQIGPLNIFMAHGDSGVSYARCFDDKTEALTHGGWRPIKEVTVNDRVATLNKDGYLEWQTPTAKFEYDWDGVLLHFKARSVDLMVTPNHNMFVRRYPNIINRQDQLVMPQKSHQRINLDWQLVEAKELFKKGATFRQKWQMSKEVKWSGEKINDYELPRIEKRKHAAKEPARFNKIKMEYWLEFLGWYIAEGCTGGKGGHKYVTILTQQNQGGRKDIITLLSSLGWKYSLYGNKTISIYGGELAEHLDKICGQGAKNKCVPDFVKELTPDQIWLFLEAALKGDGSWDKRNNNWSHYTTFSNQLKDDMQELFLKCGIGATITSRGVSLSHLQNLPTINKKPEEIQYKGKVYCVDVPNHVFLVRRNGRVIWSGNSYKLQKNIEQMSPANKPDIYFAGHWHVSCALFEYRNVIAFMIPCFQSQTPFLKRKSLYPEIGGLIASFTINDVTRKDGIARCKFEWVPYYVPIDNDY